MNRMTGILVMLLLLFGGDGTADELEDYIAHVREVRMSAGAEMNVGTTATLLLGYGTVEYTRDEASGRYWPRFTSQACASPEADPEVVAQEQAARSSKKAEIVLELHSLADLDGSGFVTDQEASTFRNQVETGFLAAQLAKEGPLTLECVSAALGISEVEAKERLDSYAIMYPVFVDLELASALPGFGAPPVQQLQD